MAEAASAVLDDAERIGRLDPSGMLDAIARLGAMVAEGWDAAAGLVRPSRAPSVLLVAGMGGSAIGGDLLRALLMPDAPVPVVVVRDERLPAFVGPQTLVVACSYSGNTEETLAAYGAARARQASVVVVTSGGELAARARAHGHPVVAVPGGLQPRAAVALLLLPLVRLACELGLGAPEPQIGRARALLDGLAARWGPAVPVAENAAKRLAAAASGLPAIYAASPATEPVALRWKTQINENAKRPAVWGALPEIAHNEVVGWEGGPGAPEAVIVLRDADDGPRAGVRVEAVRTLLGDRARPFAEVWSQGADRLERLLSLVLLGDFVSAYLAVLGGVDPTPVAAIDRVKRLLAGP
ncbi:MAG: bifunctional phosphoglucose/phosphomannose isomerase [Armatimonadota bacterium]|nr:bifunctional phosphoglucose/phosphomannose isomerase [Armatimonadota bacterium]MDR7422008.1 bifunctional phosphoglucose/phosphomannose isomerase [Armatimonadota bacterium]MDR7455208.1 bifunctional phosphoglucose/phosphomannose isomerase [Armatimonadota bacterium]MDR7455708.1 bifunctional phosphoglucose/phosphomannose isomerase [Armatimonadota bacterium]MDR7496953.1 bifunctional phosphoglucose/phosphomannose isomerase [Armatimonadota bacterium]